MFLFYFTENGFQTEDWFLSLSFPVWITDCTTPQLSPATHKAYREKPKGDVTLYKYYSAGYFNQFLIEISFQKGTEHLICQPHISEMQAWLHFIETRFLNDVFAVTDTDIALPGYPIILSDLVRPVRTMLDSENGFSCVVFRGSCNTCTVN